MSRTIKVKDIDNYLVVKNKFHSLVINNLRYNTLDDNLTYSIIYDFENRLQFPLSEFYIDSDTNTETLTYKDAIGCVIKWNNDLDNLDNMDLYQLTNKNSKRVLCSMRVYDKYNNNPIIQILAGSEERVDLDINDQFIITEVKD